MNQPILTERNYYELSKDMVSELKSIYSQIQSESMTLLNRAVYNSWTANELEFELVKLFSNDSEYDRTEIQKAFKRKPSVAMDWASLKTNYKWTGKRYGSLIKKILVENQKQMSEAILVTDKKRLERNIKSILPKTARFKTIEFPDIGNVIKKSSSIIKAADRGDLMNHDRREDMRKIIQKILTSEKIDSRGKVKKSLAQKVEKELKEYFQTYTKNSPPYGVPKNLHSIAVTETRSLVNNVRKTYMKEVNKRTKKLGYEMIKIWRHNSSLSKTPRESHRKLDNKKLLMNEKFRLESNGNVYMIDAPHDYTLPPEEVITCNCDLYYKMRKRI